MKKQKVLSLKHWIWILAALILLSTPFWINEAYKLNKGYITMWDAADALSFYGAFLSFGSTTLLGFLTLWLNRRLFAINNRLLNIEESRQRPYIDIRNEDQFIELYSDESTTQKRVRVYLKNASSAVTKRCKLTEAHLYSYVRNKHYRLKSDNKKSRINSGSILPNDNLYFDFICEELEEAREIHDCCKLDSECENMNDNMYCIELRFELFDISNKIYYQKLYSLFRDISSDNVNKKVSLWNRSLELE